MRGYGFGAAAIAGAMLMERVNYLLSAGIAIPAKQITDRISDIVLAAFPPS